MRRLVALSVLSAVVALASPALAQTAQTPPKPAAPNGDAKTAQSTSDTPPGTPTTNGDTGLWFVPTGEVLPQKKWSMSLQRWVLSEGQGFADPNNCPATFGVGIAKHAELFGSFDVVRRIDRDARPLFFTSTSTEASTGTGGGILVDNPLDRATYRSEERRVGKE